MTELEQLNERIKQLTELVKTGSEAIKSMETTLKAAEEDYIDEVGGFHSPCNCSNPNGYYCGDCTKLTCKDCKYKELKPV